MKRKRMKHFVSGAIAKRIGQQVKIFENQGMPEEQARRAAIGWMESKMEEHRSGLIATIRTRGKS